MRTVSSNRPKIRSRISNIEGLQRWPWVSPVAQTVKNLPAMQKTSVRSLDWEDPLEKETATHSSILAWRIPWTEKPDRLQSMGLERAGHNWVTFTMAEKISTLGHWFLEIVGNCFYKTSCIILSIFLKHLIINLRVSFCRAKYISDLLDIGLCISNIWASESTTFPKHFPCSSCGCNNFRNHKSSSSSCSLHSVKEETEA